jgi:hypothetical protein
MVRVCGSKTHGLNTGDIRVAVPAYDSTTVQSSECIDDLGQVLGAQTPAHFAQKPPHFDIASLIYQSA